MKAPFTGEGRDEVRTTVGACQSAKAWLPPAKAFPARSVSVDWIFIEPMALVITVGLENVRTIVFVAFPEIPVISDVPPGVKFSLM